MKVFLLSWVAVLILLQIPCVLGLGETWKDVFGALLFVSCCFALYFLLNDALWQGENIKHHEG